MKAKKTFVLCVFSVGFIGGAALGLLGAGEVNVASSTDSQDSSRGRRVPGAWTAPRIALSGEVQKRAPRLAARTERGEFQKIRGQVTDRHGKALSGVLVEVQLPPSIFLDRGARQGGRSTYVRQLLQLKKSDSTARSDKRGFFQIPQFTEQSDRINLSKPGFLFQRKVSREMGNKGIQVQFIGYSLAELDGEAAEDDEEEGLTSKVDFQVYDPNGRLLSKARVYWKGEEDSGDFNWTQSNTSVEIPHGRYSIHAAVDSYSAPIISESQSLLLDKDGGTQRLSLTVTKLPEDETRNVLLVRFKGLQVIPAKDKDDEVKVRNIYYLLVQYLGECPSKDFLTRKYWNDSRESNEDHVIDDLQEGTYMLLCGRGRGSFDIAQPIVINQQVTVAEVQLPKETKSPLKIRGLGPNGEVLKDLSLYFQLRRARWEDEFDLQAQPDENGFYSVQVPYFPPSKEFVKDRDSIFAYSDKYGGLDQIYQPGQSEMIFQFKKKKSLKVRVSGFQSCGAIGAVLVSCAGASKKFEKGSEDSLVLEIDGGQAETHTLRISAYDQNLFERTVYRKKINLTSGKNQAEVVIPKLYPLTIQANLDPGTDVDIQALVDGVSYLESSKLNGKGLARFINLPAGQYNIEIDDLSMVVSVPSPGIVPFQVKTTNALEVIIKDSQGYLAAQGFKNRDIIIGINGQRYPNNKMVGLIKELDGPSVSFLVDRQGRTVELTADPTKLIDLERHLGGTLKERRH